MLKVISRTFLLALVPRVLAGGLLILLAPLGAVLWLLVQFDSRGPFVFAQERMGKDLKPFRIYKIRTMRVDQGGHSGKVCEGAFDPRVTSIGRWLRALKIDELPQLWNVLKGDMAFVGPRPLPMNLHRDLMHGLPGFARRHEVLPGLTSAAQWVESDLEGADCLLQDWERRLELDLEWIERVGWNRRPEIIAKTVLYLARRWTKGPRFLMSASPRVIGRKRGRIQVVSSPSLTSKAS